MTDPGSVGRWVLYTDGASRGNPGAAGAGWVLFDAEQNLIERGNAYLGVKTNNEAEYEAMLRGLRAAHAAGAQTLGVRADSELLVKQLRGEYRVKNPKLRPLYEAVVGVLRNFASVDVAHVRRDDNRQADREANLAIDAHRS